MQRKHVRKKEKKKRPDFGRLYGQLDSISQGLAIIKAVVSFRSQGYI